MKRIQTLQDAPAGLATYLELTGDAQSWVEFRSYESGDAYNELRDALVNLQHGLCGYCEIKLVHSYIQVEHVIPQRVPGGGGEGVLDCANLMVCCLGGTRPADDEKHYLSPTKVNTSCGQAKGSDTNVDFLDPRALPDLPPLVRVRSTGEIEADSDACAATGFQVERVRQTIKMLGLNVRRLKRARQKKWRNLNEVYGNLLESLGTAAARQELTLGQGGYLSAFFTTARSFFGPIAETILDERPQVWI